MSERFAAFDQLTTLILVVQPDGAVLHANAAFETQMRLSRRTAKQLMAFDWFADPAPLAEALSSVH